MDDFAKTFGKQIKITRIKKDLTQQEVAARADITPSYMSRIESGSVSTSVEKLCRIAQAIGCPASELIPQFEFINSSDK
ncbi:helix-turn-helix domain-containing protein [Moritella sp. Urea-trap-13]|uniref:helix-turn-helix domain-containing protein n=1 Tax=Moritella sp. Urea-trap-13 TaxID=2058327 RepID=UPI000C333DCC|nr:helix-turn-helix transcriptional regulator [Moritella sp. Urea-trap-13]PKH08185.1 transcriptional regulator [Moritella sp. Urea-trap-13]